MRHLDRRSALYGFFRPFFETKKGRICVLATPVDNLRDGLAAAQIARQFPLPEYEGIVLEPSRRTVTLSENLMLVGSALLFDRPDAHPISGSCPPRSIGGAELRARLKRIDEECCFRIVGKDRRFIRNRTTGESHEPRADEEADLEEDYGLVRRVFRGPHENTLLLEGIHRLGTLGAVKVATSRVHLEDVWEAARKIDGFDERLPLEILVHSTFQPRRNEGVFALDTITAVPQLLVYNRNWVFDLVGDRCWRDRRPWDIRLEVRGRDEARPRTPRECDATLPRLEIRADLRDLEDRFRTECREVLEGVAGGREPVPPGRVNRVLRRLTSECDRFHVELVEQVPWGDAVHARELPVRPSPIRCHRKRFLLHLAFCRFGGRAFPCRETSIRRICPDFLPGASGRELVARFVSSVPGKLREGFTPLLGPAARPKDYLRIDYNRKERTYRMVLDRIALVLLLRV